MLMINSQSANTVI